MPDVFAAVSPSMGVTVSKDQGRIGLTVVDSPFTDGSGVIVTHLTPDSLLREHGINIGDNIVCINSKPVANHVECIEAVDGSPSTVHFELSRPTRVVELRRTPTGKAGVTWSGGPDAPPNKCSIYDDKDVHAAEQRRRERGVRIASLEEYGEAARAGLVVGDVLRAVNGEVVTSHEQAAQIVANCLGEHGVVQLVVDATTRALVLSRDDIGGMTLAQGSDGVLVIAVEEGSAADRCGVRVGDVLVSVNGALLPPNETHGSVLDRLAYSPKSLPQLVVRREADALAEVRSVNEALPRSRERPSSSFSVASRLSRRLSGRHLPARQTAFVELDRPILASDYLPTDEVQQSAPAYAPPELEESGDTAAGLVRRLGDVRFDLSEPPGAWRAGTSPLDNWDSEELEMLQRHVEGLLAARRR